MSALIMRENEKAIIITTLTTLSSHTKRTLNNQALKKKKLKD